MKISLNKDKQKGVELVVFSIHIQVAELFLFAQAGEQGTTELYSFETNK